MLHKGEVMEQGYFFSDHTGESAPSKLDLMPAVTIPREAIEAEVREAQSQQP